MRLHRITWVDDSWERLSPGAAFHPLAIPLDRQGGGRFDNPSHYAALYGSLTAPGAVGEVMANSARWIDSEVMRKKEGRPRCLVTMDIADPVVLIDLDDPAQLERLAIRPSDVVRRNRDRTQEVALEAWMNRRATATAGFTWWSYWRPEWTMVMLWSGGLAQPWFPAVDVVAVEPLTMDLPAVVVAAEVLPRQLG